MQLGQGIGGGIGLDELILRNAFSCLRTMCVKEKGYV